MRKHTAETQRRRVGEFPVEYWKSRLALQKESKKKKSAPAVREVLDQVRGTLRTHSIEGVTPRRQNSTIQRRPSFLELLCAATVGAARRARFKLSTASSLVFVRHFLKVRLTDASRCEGRVNKDDGAREGQSEQVGKGRRTLFAKRGESAARIDRTPFFALFVPREVDDQRTSEREICGHARGWGKTGCEKGTWI